ncbi:MAG: hypothetical protein LBC57_04485 [Treponema sp.]|jgi:preprotein translocase subunit SecA|nr:hypothetical protein [Treponema sp.]
MAQTRDRDEFLGYTMGMIIEQTIEVPEDHRVFLEIPGTIPQGMVRISLHIIPLKTTPPPQTSQESKRAAFQAFMKYRKAAPSGFDYKKELMEALDEKYGSIG